MAAVNLPDPRGWDETAFMPLGTLGRVPTLGDRRGRWLPGMARDRRGHVREPPMARARDGHAARAGRRRMVAAPSGPALDVDPVLPVRAGRRDRGDVPRATRAALRRLRRSALRARVAWGTAEAGCARGRGRVHRRAGAERSPSSTTRPSASARWRRSPASWRSSTSRRWPATWPARPSARGPNGPGASAPALISSA